MLAEAALSPSRLCTLAHCLSLEADLMSEDGDVVTAIQLRDRARELRDVASCIDDDR
jgi:predicted MarR family transcription regulator